jgi:hypothetical protein
MDLQSWLATIIGGGGALSIIAGGILWTTREAISKAVTQAGLREIERLKGDLAKELERERQTFARDLERERQAFARDTERTRGLAAKELESFKAELTLAAECRVLFSSVIRDAVFAQ